MYCVNLTLHQTALSLEGEVPGLENESETHRRAVLEMAFRPYT